jgi:hypothetical protein
MARDDLKQDIEQVKRLRDEIRLKLHLAGMDARDAWHELNAEADRISREAGSASRAAVKTLIERMRAFSEELRGEQPHTD